ncbi:MAG TPA: ABC transporter substrate-binding protein [candidate division Zixibacteria bacterium]|nr:ABC transporter substrate-binding protein [candidate division Zixibacteria bacterium]
MRTKRNLSIRRYGSGAVLAAVLTWVAAAPAQEKLEKVNVGYSAQAGAFAPIWITKEAGLFRKNGLDVNLVFIPGGPTAAAAMLAGEVQAAAMAGPAVVASRLAGTDLVMTAGIVNTFAFQIITVKSITSPAQLKGRRLGVNRFGTAPDIAARYALRHMGIDPSEVTILQLGEQAARLAAMKAGQLEAAVVLPPITTMAQKEGMNVLLDMSDLGAEFQITGLASSQRFITQNRPRALRMMRAFVEGIHFYKTRKKESMKIIAQYMRTSDMEAVEATYDYFAGKIVPRKPYPTLKGIKALLELAAKERPEAATAQPERFVNVSLLKELDASGFIDRLYQ